MYLKTQCERNEYISINLVKRNSIQLLEREAINKQPLERETSSK